MRVHVAHLRQDPVYPVFKNLPHLCASTSHRMVMVALTTNDGRPKTSAGFASHHSVEQPMHISPSPQHIAQIIPNYFALRMLNNFKYGGLVAFGSCSASAEYTITGIFGIGMRSCAAWQSGPIKIYEGHAWVLDFWIGLNTAGDDNLVGSVAVTC